ncbi:hypothetical protein [Ornithinibacillus sp. JPR2-1]|uniref:hypothetical protein n=1 Tax=Ornithinibacillus sp. JPR2-1 TaxID=2094019 RepID=UPI0031CDF76D
MVIKTYDTRQAGTLKVFLKIHDGAISSVIIGNQAVATEQGFQFYVDDYVAEQIDKCEFYLDGITPKLRVKEGEEIIEPELTEREKEIRRLQFELEQLQNAE